MQRCPCLTGLPYGECCEPFHLGASLAPSAEHLMRSRYSAYALGLPGYLLQTWHPATRPTDLALDARLRWCGLEILNRTRGGMLDSLGTVEFRASYRTETQPGSQHENSEFRRETGAWLYVGAIS